MGLCSQPMMLTEKLTHLFRAFGVGLCGLYIYVVLSLMSQELMHFLFCLYQHTFEFGIFMEIFRSAISIIPLLFILLRCLYSRQFHNLMNRHRRNGGSHIWSRRKIFWRHAGVSRKSYIAQASRKLCTLTTLTHVPSSHEKTQKNEKPALTAQR